LISVLAHHLRLFGWPDQGLELGGEPRLRLLVRPTAEVADLALRFAGHGGAVVAVQPSDGFLARVGAKGGIVRCQQRDLACSHRGAAVRVRTLHDAHSYYGDNGQALVANEEDDAVWLWLPIGAGGLLLIGTDLAGDLVRYRQGDPAAVAYRQTQMTPIGVRVEKPQYLYANQLDPEDPFARHADCWMAILTSFLSSITKTRLAPILPNGAPGAVIMTGDDDQAALTYYHTQLKLLGDTPVTYFLHPDTRHTRETLKEMLGAPHVDLGVHPDALTAPNNDQVNWFQNFVGCRPLSVRNHGLLNDGYWGHLATWRNNEIKISSNLTAHNGHVLNGSLLPARVATGPILSEHWSILTALSDAALFLLNMTDAQLADRLMYLANRIRLSGVAGVIVLNLHPENVNSCPQTHEAVRQLARSDFLAWTVRDCFKWFNAVDAQVMA